MKKYIVLCVMVLLGFGGINAQAAAAPNADNNLRTFNLRMLSEMLDLDYNQVVILKTYYSDTNDAMRTELQAAADPAEEAAIRYSYVVMRDVKIRAILTEEQLPIYLEALHPDVVEIDPETGGPN